jgi:hypothetical protein
MRRNAASVTFAIGAIAMIGRGRVSQKFLLMDFTAVFAI